MLNTRRFLDNYSLAQMIVSCHFYLICRMNSLNNQNHLNGMKVHLNHLLYSPQELLMVHLNSHHSFQRLGLMTMMMKKKKVKRIPMTDQIYTVMMKEQMTHRKLLLTSFLDLIHDSCNLIV